MFSRRQNWITIPAEVTELWNYALSNNLIIVTNDDDYLNLTEVKGFPSKVILLRTCNQSNDFIEKLMIKHKGDIDALYNSEDYGFLEIF